MPTQHFDITNVPTQIDNGLDEGTVYRFRVNQLNSTNDTERIKTSSITGTSPPDTGTPAHDTYGLFDGFWLKPESGETIWAWTDEEAITGRVIYRTAL